MVWTTFFDAVSLKFREKDASELDPVIMSPQSRCVLLRWYLARESDTAPSSSCATVLVMSKIDIDM